MHRRQRRKRQDEAKAPRFEGLGVLGDSPYWSGNGEAEGLSHNNRVLRGDCCCAFNEASERGLGARPNIFKQGLATEIHDPTLVQMARQRPRAVFRRLVGNRANSNRFRSGLGRFENAIEAR
jgi:hypothetical protein